MVLWQAVNLFPKSRIVRPGKTDYEHAQEQVARLTIGVECGQEGSCTVYKLDGKHAGRMKYVCW